MKTRLDLYTDYLLSSFGATTATGLSNLLDQAISDDDVTGFVHHLPCRLPGSRPGKRNQTRIFRWNYYI